ncbi:MAG: hypothetical protein J6U68_00980 [Clostridia bacterium]|nr:hypothetical protein [Clostridia bacterium]
MLTLVVIISVFSLYSCEDNREYDETEVKAAALELIKKSVSLNEIYYGEGISYVDDENLAVGPYYPADNNSLARFGIETVDDLVNKTKEVFSTEMSTMIYDTKLKPVYDSDGVIRGYSRYYQKYTEDKDPKPECILVYSEASSLLDDEVTYDYDTLRVKESKGEIVYVEIDVFVKTDDGKSQNKTLNIGLIEEADGWRLTSPTYTSYVDLDYYNQLQNKNQK